MIVRYINFLKRSVHTLPYDITQPYHKVIDLLFKLLGLTLGIYGGYKIWSEACAYFSYKEKMLVTVSNLPLAEQTIQYTLHFYDTVIGLLVGFGALGGALFVSSILIVRHLNETLPDHIYLRCFASDEERKKRLPVKA